ncbi:MAG: hypothetical protein PHN57_04375 [Candidatus Omnitrophica bacterium]|nr:hypothetical protein [Candidatus Omnitrophota bacterium]
MSTSQKDINAVSNANAIDSAIDVQTNVARVSSANAPTNNVEVNGTNSANITNYRPADAENDTFSATHETSALESSFLKNENSKSFNLDSSASSSFAAASADGSSKAFNLLETNDVTGSAATSSAAVGKTIGVSSLAANLLIDYDKIITDEEASSSSSSASASCDKSLDIQAAENCATTAAHLEKETELCKLDTSKTTRSSKGVNNHIALLENSQQSIKAVSNLNAVGAGAAVQTNIASNVGVNGSISHVNSATVSSGF